MTPETTDPPAFDLAYCEDCDQRIEGPVKVYECPDCGDTFTSDETESGEGNRSPCCGKFGSVNTRLGCPECKEEVTLYVEAGTKP